MNDKMPNSELIAYQFKTMNEKFDEHKDDTNKRFDNQDKQLSEIKAIVKEWFSSLPNTYATKKEHDENKAMIKKMQEDQASIVLKSFLAFWAVIISWIVWLIDIILKKIWII